MYYSISQAHFGAVQSLLEVLEVFCSHSRVIGTGMGKRKIVGVERISQLGPELIEIVLGTQI
jgi:hypothetical protein